MNRMSLSSGRADVPGRRVILAWTADDVSAGADNGTSRVVALTLDALCAAQRRMGPDRILDAGDLLDYDVRAAWVEQTDRPLHDAFAARRYQPGLRVMVRYLAATARIWDEILTGLMKAGDGLLTVIPPSMFREGREKELDWDLRAARASLWVLLDSYEGRGLLRTERGRYRARGARQAEWMRYARRSVQAAFGVLCLAVRRRFLDTRALDDALADQHPADVVLAGVQGTDAINQASLATRLRQVFGGRFFWFARDPKVGVTVKTEEERLLVAGHDGPDREFPMPSWRSERVAQAIAKAVAWSAAGSCAKRAKVRLSRSDWFDLLVEHAGFAVVVGERIERVLGRLRPHVVVGLSVLQDMAHVRAWCRRQGVPFVMLMHGAYFTMQWSHCVDADVVGVMGQFGEDSIREAWGARAPKVAICGSMQFAVKAGLATGFGRTGPVMSSKRIVLLGVEWVLPFVPYTLGERVQLLRTLAKSCTEAGGELVVREHPRSRQGGLPAIVEQLSDEERLSIRMSSTPSLAEDLGGARGAVILTSTSAAVDAWFLGCPVVAYVPKASVRRSMPFWVRSGVLVETAAEVDGLIKVMMGAVPEDPGFDERQRKAFAYYVAFVSPDPWAGVVDLVSPFAGPI